MISRSTQTAKVEKTPLLQSALTKKLSDDLHPDDDVYLHVLRCQELWSGISHYSSFQRFVDLEVVVAGKSFRCHRLVMCSASQWISEEIDRKGTDKESRSVVVVPAKFAISPTTFQLLLSFVYSRTSFFIDSSLHDVLDIIRAACHLRMPFIKRSCFDVLGGSATELSSFRLWELAVREGFGDTAGRTAYDTLLKSAFCMSPDWSKLMVTFPAGLMLMLLCDPDQTAPEGLLLERSLHWYSHDKAGRARDLPCLLDLLCHWQLESTQIDYYRNQDFSSPALTVFLGDAVSYFLLGIVDNNCEMRLRIQCGAYSERAKAPPGLKRVITLIGQVTVDTGREKPLKGSQATSEGEDKTTAFSGRKMDASNLWGLNLGEPPSEAVGQNSQAAAQAKGTQAKSEGGDKTTAFSGKKMDASNLWGLNLGEPPSNAVGQNSQAAAQAKEAGDKKKSKGKKKKKRAESHSQDADAKAKENADKVQVPETSTGESEATQQNPTARKPAAQEENPPEPAPPPPPNEPIHMATFLSLDPADVANQKACSSSLPPCRERGVGFATCRCKDHVLVSGGTGAPHSVDMYSISTGTWCQTGLPLGLVNHCMVAFCDYIVVLGGRIMFGPTYQCEAVPAAREATADYNSQQAEATQQTGPSKRDPSCAASDREKPSLETTKESEATKWGEENLRGYSTTSLNQGVYGMGVENSSKDQLEFKIWTDVCSLPIAVQKATASVIGQKIYVFGGCDESGKYVREVQVVDAKTMTAFCADLPSGLTLPNLRSVSTGGEIFLVSRDGDVLRMRDMTELSIASAELLDFARRGGKRGAVAQPPHGGDGQQGRDTAQQGSVKTKATPGTEDEDTAQQASVKTKATPGTEDEDTAQQASVKTKATPGTEDEDTAQQASVKTKATPGTEGEDTAQQASVKTKATPGTEGEDTAQQASVKTKATPGSEGEDTAQQASVKTKATPGTEDEDTAQQREETADRNEQTADNTEQTADSNEQTVDTKEQTVDSTDQTADDTEQTADSNEQTADSNEQTADTKEQAADTKDQTVDSNEQTADCNEQTADNNEQTADTTEQTADSNKQTVDTKEQTVDSTDQTADDTEQTADSKEQTVDSKEQTADSKEQTADSNEQTADSKEQTADSKEQTTDRKEQTADNTEQTADSKEQTTDSKEQTADNTEQTADIKEQTAGSKEQASDSKEQTVDNKEQTADSKEQTADNTEQTADSKEQTAGSKEQTADSKEQTVDNKELTANSKEQTADSKEQTADNTEQAYDSKEQTVENKEQTADSKEQTAGSKEQTADSKEQTVDNKELTANSKEQTADSKEQTADNTEQAYDSKEQTVENKEQTADSKEQTADNTEQTADSKEQTAGSKEQTADSKEQTVDNKELTGNSKEQTADNTEQTADSKEQTAGSKEQTAVSKEQTVDNKELTGNSKEQTADSNEQTADNHEQASDTKDQTVDNKKLTADNTEQTADNKEQTADSKEQTADNTEQTTDTKEQTADNTEQTADTKEQTIESKEQTTDSKEQTINSKEQTTDSKEQTNGSKEPPTCNTEQSADTKGQTVDNTEGPVQADSHIVAEPPGIEEKVVEPCSEGTEGPGAGRRLEAGQSAPLTVSHSEIRTIVLPSRCVLYVAAPSTPRSALPFMSKPGDQNALASGRSPSPTNKADGESQGPLTAPTPSYSSPDDAQATEGEGTTWPDPGRRTRSDTLWDDAESSGELQLLTFSRVTKLPMTVGRDGCFSVCVSCRDILVVSSEGRVGGSPGVGVWAVDWKTWKVRKAEAELPHAVSHFDVIPVLMPERLIWPLDQKSGQIFLFANKELAWARETDSLQFLACGRFWRVTTSPSVEDADNVFVSLSLQLQCPYELTVQLPVTFSVTITSRSGKKTICKELKHVFTALSDIACINKFANTTKLMKKDSGYLDQDDYLVLRCRVQYQI